MMKISTRPLNSVDDTTLPGIPQQVVRAVQSLVETGSGWASRIFVDDVLAGFVTLTPDGEVALYLKPEFQRRGVGTAVLKKTIQNGLKAGLQRIHAKARVGSGGAALARKVGLQQIREDGYEVFFELTV